MSDVSPEEWRTIPGWEGYYEASNRGRIRSVERYVELRPGQIARLPGKIRSPFANQGHFMLPLNRDGAKHNRWVHQLVLAAFVGPRPPGLVACHNNGDGLDNRVENLRWDTHSSNMLDRVEHGTDPNANKTHCKWGHEYTPDNTGIQGKTGGRNPGRFCKQCRADKAQTAEARVRRRVKDARYRARKRGVAA